MEPIVTETREARVSGVSGVARDPHARRLKHSCMFLQ